MMKRLLAALLFIGAAPLSAQVSSVATGNDVGPSDPAFLALQRLVEHHGCMAGYPDVTYRGNRALTRYEFAAGLNACSGRMHELIDSGQTVSDQDRSDLAGLEREFAPELATLRGRVDQLEARTRNLESQQFSTTTKLGRPGAFQLDQPGNAPANPRKIQKRKRKQAPAANGAGGN